MTQLSVRPAAVAGMFYPAEAMSLRNQLRQFLEQARPAVAAVRVPKMLVAPHAGYVYSGPVAGHAYAALAVGRGAVRRVVLLGPAHRAHVAGLAAPTVAAFDTPLGRVPLDSQALAALEALPQVQRSDAAHAAEHSLEVQLPFLQAVLGDGFTLVPLVVGGASPAQVAEALELLWGGPETLVVISSDLSHYLPQAQAQRVDADTVAHLLALQPDLVSEQACGARALNGALLAARAHGLRPRLLDCRTSGDTAGDHRRVVGYAALAFDAPEAQADLPDAGLGRALLATARQAIAQALGEPAAPAPEHPALRQPGASFVTLHDAAGALRGCIGTLEAERPLGDDVRRHARAAAFEDPRFTPLTRAEWPGVSIEVSVLTPLQPLKVDSQAQAHALLRPEVDGVLLQWGTHRATFLPQVWQQLREPDAFFAALKRKAGLPPDFWAPDLALSRYQVKHFDERSPA